MEFIKGSLTKDVELYSNPQEQLDYEKIASLILKFMVVFLNKEKGCNDEINLQDVQRIYKEINNTEKVNGVSIKKIMYPVRMLADIPKTTAIFYDIANRKIGSDSEEYFLGVDFGTGTGILSLAMYLAASRNSFENKEIFAFDKNKYLIDPVLNIFNEIGIGGGVYKADTTKYKQMEKHLPGKDINFLTNENLPFGSLDLRGGKEPFIQNLEFFYKYFLNNEKTEFFPRSFDIKFCKGSFKSDENYGKKICLDGWGEIEINQDNQDKSIEKLREKCNIETGFLWKREEIDLSRIKIPSIYLEGLTGEKLIKAYLRDGFIYGNSDYDTLKDWVKKNELNLRGGRWM